MAKTSANIEWQRALIALSGTVIFVTVVVALYWVQVVLIPVAMAVFFAFMLNPLVNYVQRLRLGRVASVLLVVTLTGLLFAGLGWAVGRQVTSLMDQIPSHTARIKEKIKSLRERQGTFGRLQKMFGEIGGELRSTEPSEAHSPAGKEPASKEADVLITSKQGPAVMVQPEVSGWLRQLPSYLGSAAETIAAMVMTLVLTVFMLLRREELRNRFLKLVGHSHMSSTTKALVDAGDRVSRYLFKQAMVNSGFGVAVAIGLYLLNVEYCLLWGFVAAVMRYVPYIGTWIAAALPIAQSVAISDGWWQPLLVFGLYLALEIISGNVVEPWLYGHSTGISRVALLVSAAFWAFLWGPLGLVLSAPLSVVLLVVGKNVPQLKFLETLLGDEPALDLDVMYYQRLLARDQDEAAQLALASVKNLPEDQVYDQLLLPALNHARRDRENDELSVADEAYIHEATRELLEDLSLKRTDARDVGKNAKPQPRLPVRVLACPARDEADRLSLEMLSQLLDPARWVVEIAAVETFTSELVEHAAAEELTLICIGALPPGGLAHARYLCKKLRAKFPAVKIVVGRWGLKTSVEENREQFLEAGADLMSTTLLETCTELNGWFPVLALEQEKTLAVEAIGACSRSARV